MDRTGRVGRLSGRAVAPKAGQQLGTLGFEQRCQPAAAGQRQAEQAGVGAHLDQYAIRPPAAMVAFELEGAQCDLGSQAREDAGGTTPAACLLQACTAVITRDAPPLADGGGRTVQLSCNRRSRAPLHFRQIDAFFLCGGQGISSGHSVLLPT
jgi:hypothetical protein